MEEVGEQLHTSFKLRVGTKAENHFVLNFYIYLWYGLDVLVVVLGGTLTKIK